MRCAKSGQGVGPLALVRSQDDERKGQDRICPWLLLCPPLFRQSITESGISTVYEAFYVFEFPATSEPLLNPYWARRAPIFPYVHKWRETVTVEKNDLAAYVLKVPYYVLLYRRLAG